MRDTKITLRNYRCFPETGATIEVGKFITALIGPNNSGKSSFLKMLYETRNVWNNNSAASLGALTQGQLHNLLGITDYAEVFSDFNDRGLSIELDVSQSSPQEITPVRFQVDRASPPRWQFAPSSSLGLAPGGSTGVGEDYVLTQNGNPKGTLRYIAEAMQGLAHSMYVGPFRNAITEGQARYYDLQIGTMFVAAWNQYKTGPNKTQNRIAQEVTETLRRIFSFGKLEINASFDHSTLQVVVDDRPYKLAELGAGLAEFIVVFANAAIQRPSFILVDEPELHLHPSLQADFVQSLASYAKTGLVFATHSVGLARAVADRLYSFRRNGSAVSVSMFEQTPDLAEFLGELSFSSFRELGCDRILLVEGAADVKTVQQWLRLFGKEHNVVIVPLGGSQLINSRCEAELSELKRLSNKISVLFDSEQVGENVCPAPERLGFADLCRKLDFRVCMTKRRALENYLSDRAIKEQLGSRFSALPPFLRLSEQSPAWAKSESWRIARRMKAEEILATDVGQFLQAL